MPKLKTLEEAYDFCLTQGNLKNLEEINLEKIRSLLQNANTNLSSAQILAKSLNKNSLEWLNVFTLSYEAFRIYAGALLLFQKMDASNHLGVFSALCLKYPELELDWPFLERMRTKRNGLNYYGESVNYQEWKLVELQLNLYLSLLKKEIEKRLA